MPIESGTLNEIAKEYGKKQPHQVDNLTEETTVLDGIKFEAASHPMWNVAEEVTDVSGGGFVDMDAPLEYADVDSKLKKVDLSIMGAKMFCPEDKAQAFGGKEKYFAKKTPKVLRKLGVDAEKSILYNNLLAYARDMGNLMDAGSTGNANCILLAVRWIPGETCGLFSPTGFGQGTLINMTAINNGGLYENENGVLGYGVRMKGYFGIQLLNRKSVASMVNITRDNMPTAMMVDDLLDKVRASKNTFLYCHPKVQTILGEVGKGVFMNMGPGDKSVNRQVADWNGVPIVTSHNFGDFADAHIDVAK